ncbi:hypothetical protein MtrunA17_Chr4g0020491 [Medicago truncatula]|nr:hypothetical protein MtrunA17_Chr4g0020491 [Medicago truncatula]
MSSSAFSLFWVVLSNMSNPSPLLPLGCCYRDRIPGVEFGWYLGPIAFSIFWEVIAMGWYWEFILLSFDAVESLFGLGVGT